MSHANGPATEFDDEKGSTAKKRKIAPPLVRNSKTFGFRSPLEWLQRKELQKETHKLKPYPDSVDEQRKRRNITWYHLVAGTCLPSKLQDVHRFFACDSNVGNRETLEVKEPIHAATAIQGHRLTNLWKHQGTQTNRALSSTKQQRSNTKHYKTTKIEHSVH